nr:basic proline-rich protein-like [Chrysemys picta bellii]
MSLCWCGLNLAPAERAARRRRDGPSQRAHTSRPLCWVSAERASGQGMDLKHGPASVQKQIPAAEAREARQPIHPSPGCCPPPGREHNGVMETPPPGGDGTRGASARCNQGLARLPPLVPPWLGRPRPQLAALPPAPGRSAARAAPCAGGVGARRPLTCPGGRSTRSAGCCGRCRRRARRSLSPPPSPRAAAAPSSPGPAGPPPAAGCPAPCCCRRRRPLTHGIAPPLPRPPPPGPSRRPLPVRPRCRAPAARRRRRLQRYQAAPRGAGLGRLRQRRAGLILPRSEPGPAPPLTPPGSGPESPRLPAPAPLTAPPAPPRSSPAPVPAIFPPSLRQGRPLPAIPTLGRGSALPLRLQPRRRRHSPPARGGPWRDPLPEGGRGAATEVSSWPRWHGNKSGQSGEDKI